MKNVFLAIIYSIVASVSAQGQSEATPPLPKRIAGIYLFSDLRGGVIRDVNGNRLTSYFKDAGFGYFRKLENGNELHFTLGLNATAGNDFFGAYLKPGFQYRLPTRTFWKGRIQPYLIIVGGINIYHARGTNTQVSGPFERRSFFAPYAGVYPGIKISLGQRIFLDISVPVEWNFMYFSHASGNSNSENNFNVLKQGPDIGLRIGAGINLGGSGKK